MKDGITEWVYLVAAVFAFVTLTATNAVVAGVGHSTLVTRWQVTVGTREHIVQTGIVIWKTFIEVLYGELHTTSVVQGLHVVKG